MSHYTLISGQVIITKSAYCPVCHRRTVYLSSYNEPTGTYLDKVESQSYPYVISTSSLCCSPAHAALYTQRIQTALHDHSHAADTTTLC